MNAQLLRRIGWLLVTALLMIAGPISGRAADASNFAAANGRYAAGDYAGAAKAYEQDVRSGRYGANLFYNLGDAYYRLGDKGRAILNYRRSLLLDPSQAEAAANLAFVKGGRSVRDTPGFAWVWQVAPTLAAVCGWLGLAGLLLALANRHRQAVGIGLATAGLSVCGLTTGLIWYFNGSTGTATAAIVVAEATPALYSPADNSKVITTLPAGGEVHILSEQGAWIYALLGEGTTRAWLSADKVERLVPRPSQG